MVQEQRRDTRDPAAEAAGMLLRLGIALICVVIPSVVFLSRRVVVILVPVALTMLILANTIISEDFVIFRRLRLILSRVAGLAAFTLVLWCILSLLWTPFPAEAGERLFKALGTFVLGFIACLSLPERMRAPNLHLVTLGTALAALTSIAVTATVLAGYRPVPTEGPTTARAAVLLAMLLWPAIAWLETRAARVQGILLLAITAAAILSSSSTLALLTLAVGFIVYCTGSILPRLTSWVLVGLVCLVIFAAPVLAIGLAREFLDTGVTGNLRIETLMLALKSWGTIIEAEPLRLMTGHGFETANKARSYGMLMMNTAPGTILDLWYDLGLIGALASAALLSSLILRCVHLPRPLAAPLMAGISCACVFALVSNTVSQIWFLSSLAVIAIAFMAVKNGQHRFIRPKAARF